MFNNINTLSVGYDLGWLDGWLKNAFCGCPVGGVAAENFGICTAGIVAGDANCGGYGLQPGGAWDAWGTKNCGCTCWLTDVCGVVLLYTGCWDVVCDIVKFEYGTGPELVWNWG